MRYTEKEKKFAIEAVKMLATGEINATECAKLAGYSAKTAKVKGCQLMKKQKIRDYIEELNPRRAEVMQEKEEAADCIEIAKRVVAEQIADIRHELASVVIPPELEKRAKGMTVTHVQTQEAFHGEGNQIGSKTITDTKELPPEVQAWTNIMNIKQKLRIQLDKYLERQRLLEGGTGHQGTVNIFIAQQDVHL